MKKKINLFCIVIISVILLVVVGAVLRRQYVQNKRPIEQDFLYIAENMRDIPLQQIKQFMKKGGDVTKEYNHVFSILAAALFWNRYDIADYIYDSIDIIESDNTTNGDREYPLFYLRWQTGSVNDFEKIIKKLSHIDNTFGVRKESSLNIMLNSSNKDNENFIKKIKLLISKGASVEVPDKYGWVSLHYIAYNPNTPESVVKIILNNASNINIANNDGMTPLMSAASEGNLNFIEFMLNSDKKHSQISLDESLLLLVKSLQYNNIVKCNASSDMPHLANNMQKTIDKLLSHGSNPNFLDKHERNYDYYWSYWKNYLIKHPESTRDKNYEDPDTYKLGAKYLQAIQEIKN